MDFLPESFHNLNEATKLADLPLRYPTEVWCDVFLLALELQTKQSFETIGDLSRLAKLPVAECCRLLEEVMTLEVDIEIGPEELKSLLDSTPDQVLLLDVREPWEFETAALAGSHLLSADRFEELLPQMQAAKVVVTICHHGIRSYSAAMYFRGEGLTHTRSLHGGLDLWSQKIDSSLPRY